MAKRSYSKQRLRKIKPIDPQKFQLFDLYVNQEWPADKVAKAFGVPVDHVYRAKHRVTEIIKERMRRLEKRNDMI
jgi:DNA-directed RNA polymerase specialized sigma24 family protein